MTCIEDGIAIRLAETLCEGVRHMADGPISVVLIDAALMRLPGSDQARLFDAVAPGVPVVALVREGTSVEETVKLEVQGFRVFAKPFDLQDVLAKVELPARSLPARPGAAAEIEALCR
jgi:DNA-binding response OmpR family regulator